MLFLNVNYLLPEVWRQQAEGLLPVSMSVLSATVCRSTFSILARLQFFTILSLVQQHLWGWETRTLITNPQQHTATILRKWIPSVILHSRAVNPMSQGCCRGDRKGVGNLFSHGNQIDFFYPQLGEEAVLWQTNFYHRQVLDLVPEKYAKV